MKFASTVVGCRLQVARRNPARKTCNVQPSTFNLPRAFTLIELLVVISILGLLAALGVPALKNLGKSNQSTSAAQQLLDDVGRARQLAIGQRTTVYMVFITTNFWGPLFAQQHVAAVTNLGEMQLTGYNFISQGKLGDQPGQRQSDWEYLSTWQSLPQNNFIAAWKFQPRNFTPVSVNNGAFNVRGFSSAYEYPNVKFPFPTETNVPNNSPYIQLPYIAFNYLGQLTTNGIDPSYQDEYIPITQGSVAYGYDGPTKTPRLTLVADKDIVETPASNSTSSMFTLVHIDALTGRARLEFQKVQ